MITAQTLKLATNDIVGSIRMWRVWYLIGTIDVRQRYRRSVLGPFWACLSMGMQALVTGLVMSVLFKQPTLTRLIDRMVRDGLLLRRIDVEDRRRTLVVVTPRG